MRTRHVVAAAVVILMSLCIDAAPRRRAVRPGGGSPPSNCEVRGLPGFYLSRDRGQTFSRNCDELVPSGSWGIAGFVGDPDRLLSVSGATFYDSTDGGLTWTPRYTIDEQLKHALHVVPATGGRAFVWAEEFVFRYDRGEVIRLSTPEPPGGLGVDPGDNNHVLFIAIGTGRVYESRDGGATWTSTGSAGGVVNAAEFDPTDVRRFVVALMGQPLFLTRDGGRTWSSQARAARTVCRLAFAPSRPNVLWMTITTQSTLPTVFRSTNSGQSFEPIGSITGLENGVCVSVAANPHNPDELLVPLSTIRTYDAVSKTVSTSTCCNGPIVQVGFSPVNPELFYVHVSR